MQIRFYFQKINKADEESLEQYFNDKKIGRLTRLLRHGNLEAAKFVVSVKYHQRHNVYLVRLGLKIIKHDLNSEKESRNLHEAFDLALDDIIIQLRKLEEKMHNK